ncbi:hypothetical protein HYU15_02125 [Candidatus Woesearchaeota archaeon]|nr:hypothetical protein [Candidatus Woesearchaeota archaeon]
MSGSSVVLPKENCHARVPFCGGVIGLMANSWLTTFFSSGAREVVM